MYASGSESGPVAGSCEHGEPSGFHKRWEISCLDESLLVSQGRCSMELDGRSY